MSLQNLLVLLVIVIAVGIWRSRRRSERQDAQRPTRRPHNPAQLPQDMVACAHCGLHLPRAEALEHAHRHYCCAEHRSAGPR